MKILIFGSDGFIGRQLAAVLRDSHTVFLTTRSPGSNKSKIHVNLLDGDTIAQAIEATSPDVIVNCAGIVDASQDVTMNTTFTTNILEAAIESKKIFRKIVVLGSAGEYGQMESGDLPVRETHPLNATSAYGLSKIKETEVALRYRTEYSLPIVVARIFNPIGAGMNPKFLIIRILQQIEDINRGLSRNIQISRLDATRDYISIRDVVGALRLLIENECKHDIYNIGSGVETSNQELIDLLVKHSKMIGRPQIVELSGEKEPGVASQADISRLREEFGWSPKQSLESSVKEIIDDTTIH